MRHTGRTAIALALAFTLLSTGTALAHPDHPGRPGVQDEDFPGEGVVQPGDKNHEGEDGHLPAVQENVELVGRAEITNPAFPDDPAGNDGRVTDVYAYDFENTPRGPESYAYLGAYFEPACVATGVHTIDINDLENPFEVEEAFIQTSPGNYVGEGVQVIRIGGRDVLIHQNETCDPTAAGPFGGINLYDVTDPLFPETITAHAGDKTVDPEAGELPLPTPESARTVHSFYAWTDEGDAGTTDDDKTYAVLVDNEELTDVDILDITDPENPVLVNDTLDLVELFGVDQEEPDNLTQVFSHDFDVQRAPDGRYILLVDYWDGGYVILDVTDPTAGNVTLIQETDFEDLDPERLERGQEISPEGNAHQGEMSSDFEWMVNTDEDFAPYRQVATLSVDGTEFAAGSGSGTPQVTPEEPFNADSVIYAGGTACNGEPVAPAPADEFAVGLAERGTCTFTEKIANLEAAGYDAVVIANSSVPGNCSGVLNMSAEGNVPSFFIGRDTAFALFNAPYDEAECQAGGQPFPAAAGEESDQGFTIESVFDGWGYVRLYNTDINATDNNRVITSAVDTYAVPESQDPAFATGFGDLSVHEVALDPEIIPSEDGPGLAYFSYYAAGFRVAEYGPDGFNEVGVYIGEEGNNFWGVEVYDRDDSTYVLASDRDYGLYIFDYLGDGDDPGGEPVPPDPEPEPEEPVFPAGDIVTRISGPDRIQTAINISQAFFASTDDDASLPPETATPGLPESITAGAVVLSRADLFPDSLSGSPLAIDQDAPLLLTGSDDLDDRVAEEIQRMLPETATVYLLGGTDALSDEVESDVEELGYETVRYGGASRYETARIIADEGLGSPETVLLADGNDFPDAVSAGAAGGVADAAVLLTGSETPAPDTTDYLETAESVTAFAVGGPAAAAYPDATPLVGETRFETAVEVATEFFSEPPVFGLATGGDFADALAGGAAVGRLGGPLLLTGQDALPDGTLTYLEDNRESLDAGYVFGGTDVISDDVLEEAEEAITDMDDGTAEPDEAQAPQG